MASHTTPMDSNSREARIEAMTVVYSILRACRDCAPVLATAHVDKATVGRVCGPCERVLESGTYRLRRWLMAA